MLTYSQSFTRSILIVLFLSTPGLAQADSASGNNAAGEENVAAGSPTSSIESISVATTRHRQREALISQNVRIDELSTATGSLSEALALHPSVSLNGQPFISNTNIVSGAAAGSELLNGMRLTSKDARGYRLHLLTLCF